MSLNESLITTNSSLTKDNPDIKDLDDKSAIENNVKEQKIKYYSTDGDIYTESSYFSKLVFHWAYRIIKVTNLTIN